MGEAMGYDFYCLHCGRKLNQDSPEKGKQVLFDMWHLFTDGSASGGSQILKLRLSSQDFSQLFTGEKDDDDYYLCTLTFSQIAQYMSNDDNLNDPEIASLTMEEVRAYCNHVTFGGQSQVSSVNISASQISSFSLDDDLEEDEEPKKEDTIPETPVAEYVKPAAILALEKKVTAIKNDLFTTASLGNELSFFVNIMPEGETFKFWIKKIIKKCVDGSSIVTGYIFRRFQGASMENAIVVNDARVCAKCGAGVFDEAGTAEHRAITFIGQPSSGKTSTILAATSYVKSRSKEISPWNVCMKQNGEEDRLLDQISNLTMTIVSPSTRLIEDLNDYSEAVAPEKTAVEERTKAYSAVFKVQYGDRVQFLTLTDLPGELCLDGGNIDLEKIVNEFQVAVNCDAYVVCFDTRACDSATTDVCSWAERFQEQRAKTGKYYVPMMLLFTKCEEIEEEYPNAQQGAFGREKKIRTPEERTYLLDDERLAVSVDKYSSILSTFSNYANLKRAYNAILRCSPFGFSAVKKANLAVLKDEDKAAYKQQHRPRNVERLLHWLLCVTGCIPVEAKIYTSGSDVNPSSCTTTLRRTQYRLQNPENKEEAVARCAIFSNPGNFDSELRANYQSRWESKALELKAKLVKDTNLPSSTR